MSEARDKTPLGEVIEMVCDYLPEDWTIQLELMCGQAAIDLIDADGEIIEVCDDDLTLVEMFQRRVDHARLIDGLEPQFDDRYTL
jgi:hypothetical protein